MRFTNDEIVDAYSEYLDAIEDDSYAAQGGVEADGDSAESYRMAADDSN